MEKDLNKEVVENVAEQSTKKKAPSKKTVDDVKPSDRVSIDNLCDWDIGFVGIETNRDITIAGGVKNFRSLTVAEVDAQVKTGNIAFCGEDGFGKHASIRINDPLIREYVFQKAVDPLQLTEENVRKLLSIQDKKKFHQTLSDLVVKDHEKKMITRLVERVGRDDMPSYQIVAIEKLSGIKFEN